MDAERRASAKRLHSWAGTWNQKVMKLIQQNALCGLPLYSLLPSICCAHGEGPKLSQPAAGHKVQHLLPIAPPACPHKYTLSPQTNLQSIFISSFLGLRRLIFFPRIPRTCSQKYFKIWKGAGSSVLYLAVG